MYSDARYAFTKDALALVSDPPLSGCQGSHFFE